MKDRDLAKVIVERGRSRKKLAEPIVQGANAVPLNKAALAKRKATQSTTAQSSSATAPDHSETRKRQKAQV